jgi:CDP-2,3-bis-(O-geranylgeranyl)-sn-glycerol synthase
MPMVRAGAFEPYAGILFEDPAFEHSIADRAQGLCDLYLHTDPLRSFIEVVRFWDILMFISAVYNRYWRMPISLDFLLLSLVSALWIMLPAYLPNSVAAVLGGGRAIDGGRVFADGRRIFGDGKTWRGLFSGITAGIVIGVVQIWARDTASLLILPELIIPVVVLLASGALLGDLVKSFFKRRLNKDQGAEWLIADQYDFVLGAFIMLLLFQYDWVVTTITPLILVWILIITPLLHRVVNIIGYLTGVKDVPW